MDTYSWYQTLIKPSWAPPSWLFGPVWIVLYTIILVSYSTIFYRVFQKQLPAFLLLPLILNLTFNFAFSPLQLGLRSNLLASVDILLTLVTLIWALLAVYPHLKWFSLINLPYLVWVSFATILQLTITWLNG